MRKMFIGFLCDFNTVAHGNCCLFPLDDIKMAGLLFSTFFGGDSSYYAPKGQERIFFKDFSIYG